MNLEAKVLVMEDEPLVRLMICSALEQHGAVVYEAGCCAEAFELIHNTSLDAAVFDYRLPDGDGLDLVSRMRQEGIGLPVILMSGESVELEKEAEQVSGIVAVLPKPPDPDQLISAIAQAAGSSTSIELTHVGHYAYWNVVAADEISSPLWNEADWLAVDLSDFDMEPGDSLLECLMIPRKGIAMVNAGAHQREFLESHFIPADYVSDKDELEALSRRPSTPLERSLLLESVIQRPGVGTHA